MNSKKKNFPFALGSIAEDKQSKRIPRFGTPSREHSFGVHGSLRNSDINDINAHMKNDMEALFGNLRRSQKKSEQQRKKEQNQGVFGRKIIPQKETTLRQSMRDSFGPRFHSPVSQKEQQQSQLKPSFKGFDDLLKRKEQKREDLKSRFNSLLDKESQEKDSPPPRIKDRISIFKPKQKEDIKRRLLALLPDSIRQKREKSMVQKVISQKQGSLSPRIPSIIKDAGALLEGDTLTSAKEISRAKSLSPFAKKFLTKKAKTHQFQDLERLVAEQAREANLQEGRFSQLTEIGDIVTQSCRSESYKVKLENKNSMRLNATSLTVPPDDPLRRDQDKYGRKGTFLFHQGQHLLYSSLKLPFEIQQALSNYPDQEANCGILGEAGIAYFIFGSKIILWSYLADAIERQSDFSENQIQGNTGKVLISKDRTSSVFIVDSEIQAISVALVPLNHSFLSKIQAQFVSQGTRASLKHKLEEPPFLIIITTLQYCHFFKVSSLAPKLLLEKVEDQQCSSQNERIDHITALPNGRVFASCIWGQLCQIELKDVMNIQSYPQGAEGRFFPPHRRPALRDHGPNIMTAKKNLESSMIGDLFRRMSRFHAQRQVIQLAQDETRFYIYTVVRARPVASPQIRIYDLGQIGTDFYHAVNISSKDIRRKLRELERKTRGMVREREPLHYGSVFDIAGVVPLLKSHSQSAHAIIVTRSGMQIYIKLKTSFELKQIVEQGQKRSSKYVSFFRSLVPWRRDNQHDYSEFMKQKGWMQEAYERIKGSSFEITALAYPPHSLSLEEIHAQELSSNGLAVSKEIHTKYECSTASPIAHIYKVIPTRRGFMAEALLNQEQESMQGNRARSMPPSNNLQSERYKRVVIEFSVDDMNLSKLHLAPSSHNQKNQVAKHCPGIDKSQIISVIHDGTTDLLAISECRLGLLALSVDLPHNLEDRTALSKEHVLKRDGIDQELDCSHINGQNSIYSVLTRAGLKLFIKRRPIDVVAETLQKLANGEAIQEEIDGLIEAYGHIEFAGLLLAVLMNGSHSIYFLHSSKNKEKQRSANLSRRILDWEKETILKSVIYDARSSDMSRLSALVKSASGKSFYLPCVGQVLTKPVLELIKKLFFKVLQAAPRVEGAFNLNNQTNRLGFQKERTPANPQTESLILALGWLMKAIWLKNVFVFHPSQLSETFSVNVQVIEAILPKLGALRQFFVAHSLQFGLTESQSKREGKQLLFQLNPSNQLTSSILSFIDYIFQGLDLLHQIIGISGPQNLGLYIFRRLPLQIINEFKSLDFMTYLTSKQGRQFAKQLVSAQLADQMCWGDKGSDSWVQKLGLRCPFVFSHSIILVEKLHSYVLQIRRQYQRVGDQQIQIRDNPQDLRNLARRCLVHVDISYTVWNLLHTNRFQYLETALDIIIDALLLEKFKCLNAQGYKGARTFLTVALHSNQKRNQRLDLFNEWISQMSMKFLKHPPIDAAGNLMDPTISLDVPFIPSSDTPLQNGENPRLFQIIQILSTYYLLLKDVSLARSQNNPREVKMFDKFSINQLNDMREKLIRLAISRTAQMPALHIHLFRLTSLDLRLPFDSLTLSDSPEVIEQVIEETKSLRTLHPGRATFLAQFLLSAEQIEALCNYCLAVAKYDQTLRGLQTFYEIPIERVILLEQRQQILILTLNALEKKQTLISLREQKQESFLQKDWIHSKRTLGFKEQEKHLQLEDSSKTNLQRKIEEELSFMTLQVIVHQSLVAHHNTLPQCPDKEEEAKFIEILDRRPAENLVELRNILSRFQLYDSLVELIITRCLSKQALKLSLEQEDQLHKDLEAAYSQFITKVYTESPKNPAQRLLPRLKELRSLNNDKTNHLFPLRTILFVIELESLKAISLNPSLNSDDIFHNLIRKSNPEKQLWAIDLCVKQSRLPQCSEVMEVLILLPQIYDQIDQRECMGSSNPKPKLCLIGKKVIMSHLMIGCMESNQESFKWKEKVETVVEKVIEELDDQDLRSMISVKSMNEIEMIQQKLIDELDLMNRRLERGAHRGFR